MRPTSRMPAPDASPLPTAKGMTVSPVWSAENPSPICRNRERVRNIDGRPEKKTMKSSIPTTKLRLWNSEDTISGSLPAASRRRSKTTNTAITTTDPASIT